MKQATTTLTRADTMGLKSSQGDNYLDKLQTESSNDESIFSHSLV